MDTETKSNQTPTSTIRTMRTDAEIYAKEKKLSSLQINAAEYIKRSADTPAMESNSSRLPKKIFVIAVVLIAAVLLGGGSWLIVSRKTSNPATSAAIPTPPSFVAHDGQIPISFKETNPSQLAKEITTERLKRFRSGALIYLPIKEEFRGGETQYISAADIMKILGLRTPALLSGILDRDYNLFLFGQSGSSDIVLVLKVSNFEKAFSSMLEWEKTLARDWQIFAPEENLALLPKLFTDDIVKNNDVRVLRNNDGADIVGYSIFNKKYIVISSSLDAIKSILERFIQLPQ